MTTIYLMVKTHQTTGLKYLCKTIRNPFTYEGSGLDWVSHLKKYGKKYKTEIIKECLTQEELSYWGRYFSHLWNVVGAMDDYGNKIWANRIPETGGGPGSKKGRVTTEQHLSNLRAAAKIAGAKKIGTKRPGHGAKVSKKLAGVPKTVEHKKNLSISLAGKNKGKKQSADHVAKRTANQKGSTRSAKSIAKQWATRRANALLKSSI